MPNENAIPRNACGSAKKRLKNGYAIAIATAGIDHAIVARFVGKMSTNAASASAAASTSASRGVMIFAASGRDAVRATKASKSRSAQSLNAQPAERMSSVPTAKIATSETGGTPSAANHSADIVGHSNNSVPIGSSRRSNRTYAAKHELDAKRTRPSAAA